jgi:hypothetical protein
MRIIHGLVLQVVTLLFLFGCDKQETPFSTNAVQPTQGEIKAMVFDGVTTASSVMVKAVDPNGNALTTISDSTGVAVFDPIPFTYGNWVVTLPNQAHRCYDQAEPLTMTAATNSQSVSLQDEVVLDLKLNVVTYLESGTLQTSEGTLSLSTTNDCGVEWNVYMFPFGVSSWSVGNSGTLNGSTSHTFSMKSGDSVPYEIITSVSGFDMNYSISSAIGSKNGGSNSFNLSASQNLINTVF